MIKERQLFGIVVLCLVITFLVSTTVFIHHDPAQPVGYATTSSNASVDIHILEVISITLLNDTLNFGTCAVDRNVGFMIIDSALNFSGANNSRCITGNFPDALVLQNNGNVHINISASFSQNSSSFFNDADSWFLFKAENNSQLPGCAGSLTDSYTNVSYSGPYQVCDNLTFGPNTSSINVFLRARINLSAEITQPLSISFSASQTN